MELDRAVSVIATRQHGLVTRQQLLAVGMTVDQIRRRQQSARLIEVASGVYAVGHAALSRRARACAALLQVGDGLGAISHSSAARAWDMLPARRDEPIHVSVVDRRHRVPPKGTVLHRPRTLSAADIVPRFGLATTTPERTLVDLIPTSSVVALTRILERMVTILGRSPDALHAWAPSIPAVRGRVRVFNALDHVVGPAVLRSELEGRFRSVCQIGALPFPETNVRLGRWEVDVYWRTHGVVVELDSYRHHGGRWQFHQDREKGMALAAMGYEVLRLTWPQVTQHQARVAKQLHMVLARHDGTQPSR